MPYLRKIRKNRWHDIIPWLQSGDIQADALGDLNTSDNQLSVWLVDNDKSYLEQIVAAITATRDHISNFDYVLFQEEDVLQLNIKVVESPGKTPSQVVNSWHVDFTELTGEELVALAHVIQENGQRERIPEKRVLDLLAQGFASQQIDREKVSLSRKELDKIDRTIEKTSKDVN